jgi:hypothetical protein
MADVISIAVIAVDFCRVFAPSDGMWRVIYPFARHLSLVALHIVLQNFLLSACYSG